MTIPTSLGIHVFNVHCERLKIAAMARKRSNTGALMVLARELPSTTMIPCEEGRLVLHNFQVYHQYMLYATYINACVGWMFDIRQGHIMSCHVSHVCQSIYSYILICYYLTQKYGNMSAFGTVFVFLFLNLSRVKKTCPQLAQSPPPPPPPPWPVYLMVEIMDIDK